MYPRLTQYPHRYCVIYADTSRLDDVAKIWVPNYYYKGDKKIALWDAQAAITTYINEFNDNGWDAKKTLRMSEIRWKVAPNDLQMVIPPELVAAEGAMGLSAVCKEKLDDLPDKETISYDDWHNNIGGSRKPPPKPEDD